MEKVDLPAGRFRLQTRRNDGNADFDGLVFGEEPRQDGTHE